MLQKPPTTTLFLITQQQGKQLLLFEGKRTAQYNDQVARCQAVFKEWRMLPAPKRGEIVRRIGNAFREI